jgi:glycosyltransferase involved in cell wall biosynthesis
VTPGRVVVDLVAPQSPSYRERGIARHGLDFAQALVEGHGDLVDRVLLHPELPPVGGLDRLIASGKVATDLENLPSGGIFHVTSAFEPEVPARALWPRAVSRHRMRLVVTLYDLIPDIFPEMYLVDPGLRRRWRACRELVRVADHVLTLARSGTEDVVRLLGVPESRVSVIGAGCDQRFHPAESVPAALAEARRAVQGLAQRFLVYNGAIDPRKNLDRLVAAYAALPERTRATWQLVLVCRAEESQRNHYLVMAEQLGVAGRVLLPGFIPDRTLVHLYQAADLMVFPSLYEGYGLPVVEARACGTPVIAADNSSLRELVADDARFDGESVPAIAAAMQRALTDPDHRAALLATAALPAPTWAQVADRTAEVYEDLLTHDARPRTGGTPSIPGWRRRPQVAVITPLPDTAPGPGLWGLELTEALRRGGAEVDVFADGDPTRRSGTPRVSALPSLDHWRGGYDLVVCCVGDDPAHCGAVALLSAGDLVPSDVVVVAHQLSLRRAYVAAAAEQLLREDLVGTVARMYPGIPPDVGRGGLLPAEVAARHGILLCRDAIGAAGRFLVADDGQAGRARLEARPGQAGSVEVAALPDHRARDGDGESSFAALADALLEPARHRLDEAAGRVGR